MEQATDVRPSCRPAAALRRGLFIGGLRLDACPSGFEGAEGRPR